MAVRTPVKLYYDVLSPYAWFGFESLCRYQKPWNLDLQLKPLSLGHIMKESGNKPPGMNPFKGSMLARDVQRAGEMMHLPYVPLTNFADSVFIKGSTSAMRVLAAAQIHSPDHLEELTRQLWLSLYSRQEDITDNQIILKCCQLAGEGEELMEQSKSGGAKQQMIDNTNEALQSKCFGAPWFTTVNPKSGRVEKFFGHDRVEMLGWVLDKKYVGHNPPSVIE